MKNARRVAVNTVVQYAQLIANVILGLFAVRIILDALGETDYGVYSAVAGVVALLGFIGTSLSQTSIRFISVALGKNEPEHTRIVFRNCFWLHLIIAGGLSVLLLLVGLFLFDGFLNIPDERVAAARLVYFCMVFSLFAGIVKTPFSALIIAHEKFVYTSGVGVLDSICKLGIALGVASTHSDKLVFYAVLMAGVEAMNFLLFFGYCAFKYSNLLSFRRQSPSGLKEVSGFAGWTLMDVMGSVLNRQGYAILLNRVFGPVTNSTFAIASQVEGHMYTVSASAINAMKPQIMKSHGSGDSERMFRLSMTAGKFGFSLMSLITIPLIVFMPEVLDLWLKEVPPNTALFARLMVTACMVEQLTRGLVYANQAVGNIKWFSIIVSSLRAMALPLSWVALRLFHAPSFVAIVIFLICESIGSLSRVFILSRISDFKVGPFFRMVLIRVSPPVVFSLGICLVLRMFLHGIGGMLCIGVVSAAAYAAIFFLFSMTGEEKMSVRKVLLNR